MYNKKKIVKPSYATFLCNRTEILALMHDVAIHGFAPTYLRELVSIKRPGNYNLRSSSDGLLLATPTCRSRVTLGDRSFQVAAPALWNVLPREIRSITHLGIFKRHLKTHLFREAFYKFINF